MRKRKAADMLSDTTTIMEKEDEHEDDEMCLIDDPVHLFCPITQTLLHDPVITKNGHTYERKAIELWLKTHDTDPVSNEHLASKTLIPNRAVRSLIDAWLTTTFALTRHNLNQSLSASSSSSSSASSSSSSSSSSSASSKGCGSEKGESSENSEKGGGSDSKKAGKKTKRRIRKAELETVEFDRLFYELTSDGDEIVDGALTFFATILEKLPRDDDSTLWLRIFGAIVCHASSYGRSDLIQRLGRLAPLDCSSRVIYRHERAEKGFAMETSAFAHASCQSVAELVLSLGGVEGKADPWCVVCCALVQKKLQMAKWWIEKQQLKKIHEEAYAFIYDEETLDLLLETYKMPPPTLDVFFCALHDWSNPVIRTFDLGYYFRKNIFTKDTRLQKADMSITSALLKSSFVYAASTQARLVRDMFDTWGCSVELVDEHVTALHCYIAHYYASTYSATKPLVKDVIKTLLRHHVDATKRNAAGLTPFDMLRDEPNRRIFSEAFAEALRDFQLFCK